MAARVVECPVRSISSRRLAPALAASWFAGMAQVVEVDHRESGRAQSWLPDAAGEVAAPQRSTLRTGEDKPVITGRGVGADVQGEVGDDDLGDGYQPMTGR